MKKGVLTVFVSFFLAHVYAQEVHTRLEKQQMKNIDKIKHEILKNIGTYQKIEKFKDSTGYRDVFIKDKELQLVIVDFKDKQDADKLIDKKVEWYFSKGELIFSQQIWTDLKSDKIVDNERFYICNGHLIKWFKFKNWMDKNEQEFKDADRKLVEYAIKLKEESLK